MEPARDQGSLVGQVLEERYRILGELGAGGFGAVYRAEHLKLGREVALKVLHGETAARPELRARFETEARALAALSHPHIVTVTDYGVAGDGPYLVMELLHGETLRDRIERGPLPEEEARAVARQILRGLAYAHAEGVAHRDLKPPNVFLQRLPDSAPHVRLLDFGLAKFFERDAPSLTRTGAVLGTPAYMAPEQCAGEPSDARSDTYAVGILIYEMLTGRRPYEGTPAEILRQHLASPVPELQRGNASVAAVPELDAFLRKALSKERPDRFEDGRAMLAALESLPQPWLRADPPPRRSQMPTHAGLTSASGAGDLERLPPPAPVPRLDASAEERKGAGCVGAILVIGALVAIGGAAAAAFVWASGEDGATRDEGRELLADLPLVGEAEGAEPGDRGTGAVEAAGEAGRGGGAEAMEGPAEALSVEEALSAEEADVEAPSAEEVDVEAPSIEAAPLEGTDAVPPEKAEEATVEAESVEEGAADDVTTGEPGGGRPSEPNGFAPDPWEGSQPRILSLAKRRVDDGLPISERLMERLTDFARDHRDDPRPLLVLGRGYLIKGWRSDAIRRYEMAYGRSRDAIGDPQMLPDLIALAAHASTSARATRLLEQAYGARALPALDRALESGEHGAGGTVRLRAVRDRLR